MSILIGVVVNFFFYDVFGSITLDHYMVKLILLVLALIFLAFAVGAVMVLDVVTFALEGFCMALAKKTKWKFAIVRQGADILSIVLSLLLTLALSLPFTLREGTIIGMLIFAPLMGFFMKRIEPVFKRFDLLDEKTGKDKDTVEAI